MSNLFETQEYVVEKIDGDYAYLNNLTNGADELKCVARALLPEEIGEGTHLRYEMMSYEIV